MARKYNPNKKPAVPTHDATQEFKPFDLAKTDYHGHPRRRYGATEAKRLGITKRELWARRSKYNPRAAAQTDAE